MPTRLRPSHPPIQWALAPFLVALASLGSASRSRAQPVELSASGNLGVAVLEGEVGGAIALGPRLVWGRLVTTAVADLTVVPHREDRYGWGVGSEGVQLCRDSNTGETVNNGWCLRETLHWALLLDAGLVLGSSRSTRPFLGGGVRVGDVSTPFASIGLTGRLGSGYPWHVRFLAGDRFVQLHFGVAAGRPVR
jgi:hypothetical protein